MTFRAISAPVRSLSRGRRAGIAVAAGAGLVLPLMGMSGSASAASSSTWDQVAQCESTGNWGISNGNGFSGGLQFTPSTWKAYGGGQYASDASQASKSQQIAVAERVLAGQGPGAWPVCSQKAGLGKGGDADATAAKSDKPSGKTKSTVESKAAPEASAQNTAGDRTTANTTGPKTGSGSEVQVKSKSTKNVTSKVAPKSTISGKHAAAEGGYTVRAGDTLSSIAAKTGVEGGWKALADANAGLIGDNPDLINVGANLTLSV